MNNLSLIRGGQVLDIRSDKLEPIDILIEDQRIVELIRPPQRMTTPASSMLPARC